MASKVLLIIFLILIGIVYAFNISVMGTIWGVVIGIAALAAALASALNK